MSQELLSQLSFDGELFWTGQFYVPFWAARIEVAVDADERGPSARQLDCLAEILAFPRCLRETFAVAIKDYYGDMKGFDSLPGDRDAITSNQVWDLICNVRLYIPEMDSSDAVVRFGIAGDCQWDKEHGFGVMFRNWKVWEVGAAYIV